MQERMGGMGGWVGGCLGEWMNEGIDGWMELISKSPVVKQISYDCKYLSMVTACMNMHKAHTSH